MKREMDPRKLRAMEACGREIAAALERAIQQYSKLAGGEKWGFALMLFGFGDSPEFTWISNANRQDMIRTMQEFIARNPPDQTSEARS